MDAPAQRLMKEKSHNHVEDVFFNKKYRISADGSNQSEREEIPKTSFRNALKKNETSKAQHKSSMQSYIDLMKLPVRKDACQFVERKCQQPFDEEARGSRKSLIDRYDRDMSRTSSMSSNEELVEQSLKDLGYDPLVVSNWHKIEQLQKTSLYVLLRKMIENREMTGVIVSFENDNFHCHLMVLHCYSSFFREFTHEHIIFLPDTKVTPEGFAAAYEWMITDNARIDRKNIIQIYRAAIFLDIEEILSQCWHLIGDDELFTEDAAFMLCIEAAANELDEIKDLLLPRVNKFFLTAVASFEFLRLKVDDVVKFLSSNSIGVNSEIEVFFSAVRWLNYDLSSRLRHCQKVMSCVRFTLMPPWFLVLLQKKSMAMEVTSVTVNQAVKKLIETGLIYATSVLQFGGKGADLDLFLKDLDLEPPAQRAWIYDEKCPYHQDDNSPGSAFANYEIFLGYLTEIKQRNSMGDWKNYKTCKMNLKDSKRSVASSNTTDNQTKIGTYRSLKSNTYGHSNTDDSPQLQGRSISMRRESDLSSEEFQEKDCIPVVTRYGCKNQSKPKIRDDKKKSKIYSSDDSSKEVETRKCKKLRDSKQRVDKIVDSTQKLQINKQQIRSLFIEDTSIDSEENQQMKRKSKCKMQESFEKEAKKYVNVLNLKCPEIKSKTTDKVEQPIEVNPNSKKLLREIPSRSQNKSDILLPYPKEKTFAREKSGISIKESTKYMEKVSRAEVLENFEEVVRVQNTEENPTSSGEKTTIRGEITLEDVVNEAVKKLKTIEVKASYDIIPQANSRKEIDINSQDPNEQPTFSKASEDRKSVLDFTSDMAEEQNENLNSVKVTESDISSLCMKRVEVGTRKTSFDNTKLEDIQSTGYSEMQKQEMHNEKCYYLDRKPALLFDRNDEADEEREDTGDDNDDEDSSSEEDEATAKKCTLSQEAIDVRNKLSEVKVESCGDSETENTEIEHDEDCPANSKHIRQIPSLKTVQCFQRVTEKLIVFGGHDASNKIGGDVVLYYDYNSSSWKYLTNTPFPSRQHFCAVECLGLIYVVGGTILKNNEYNTVKEVYVFDTHNLKWSLETQLPEPRKNFAAIAISRAHQTCNQKTHNHGIYVIGGQDGKGCILNTVWYYDIKRKNWQRKTNLNMARYGLTATLVNNEIVVAGGVVQNRAVCSSSSTDPQDSQIRTHLVITNTVEIYRLGFEHTRCHVPTATWNYTGVKTSHSNINKWIICKSNLRMPRAYGKLCLTTNGHLFLGGGICHQHDKSLETLASIDGYDFATKQWYQVCKMDCHRYDHDMVEYMKSLVIIGGCDVNSRAISDIFMYNIRKESKGKPITSLPWPVKGAIAIVMRS